ncbi:hypothetical protein pipiens_008897 [Culex pipiens pipiens]|uniref:Uncharacterized protein n=1 Tax=Culex pipiens pipiens TaxID=38569 RepID=A0ABD1DFU3_CULPP
MQCASLKIAFWLLVILELYAAIEGVGAHVPGPGPGPGVVIGARRRSSNDGAMQSRAVDTRVQFEIFEGEARGTVVGYIPTKPGFTYRFNEPPREFILDPNTGEIKTNAMLDREITKNDRYDRPGRANPHAEPRCGYLLCRLRKVPSPAPGYRQDAATDKDVGENKVTDDYRTVDG